MLLSGVKDLWIYRKVGSVHPSLTHPLSLPVSSALQHVAKEHACAVSLAQKTGSPALGAVSLNLTTLWSARITHHVVSGAINIPQSACLAINLLIVIHANSIMKTDPSFS